MTKHTKQALIISVAILLALCAGATVFAHRQHIKHWYWWWTMKYTETTDEEKIRIFKEYQEAKALYFLGKILADETFSNVRTPLGIPNRSYYNMQLAAVYAIKKIGGSYAIDILIEALDNPGGDVRVTVIWELGEIGSKKAVMPLIELLKDEDVMVCIEAEWALGRLRDRRAVEPLIERLKIVVDAVHKGKIEDLYPGGCEPLMQERGKTRYCERKAIASALASIGDRRAIKPLQEATELTKNRHVQSALWGSLCGLKLKEKKE